jgi:tetratricopeptide (TPR) repeat protein
MVMPQINPDDPSGLNDEPLSAVLTMFGLDDQSAASDRWLELVREAARVEPLRRLGRFELLHEVCRGGQGIIYRARDMETGQIVAVKRLVSGPLASPTSQRRIERELETIAILKHDGIVEALGLEVVEGQPLLAMKWIDGVSITHWARRGEAGRRSPRDIVAMLRKVCQALQHAHQRGVIHRDLKPSNILVDANGQPHLLDFGLAKFAASKGEPTLTISEQFIGTLRYASPEQLAGSTNEVDVRSDVFSLGVIAYQMLTGRLPFHASATASEALEAIRNTRVQRPSELQPQIDRDLDIIVLKALSPEPQLRYQSVDALDADLERHQKGEPILARAQSTAYLVRKLIRRHKVGFTLGVVVAVLVIGGGIVAAVLAAQLDAARKQEHQARLTAEKISAFLHDIIAAADPVANPETGVTARDLLDRAAERLGAASAADLAGQPAVEAALHHTIGVSFMNLGIYDAADDHLSRALRLRMNHYGDLHDDVAETQSMLATLRYHQRRFPEAEAMCRSALRTAQSLHGDSHIMVARQVNDLAAIRRAQGALDDAESLFRQSLTMRRDLLGGEHPDVAETLNNLANILRLRGDLPAAEQMCRQALEIRQRTFGERHFLVAQTMGNLGVVVGSQGRIRECEELMRKSLAMHRELLGSDHPSVQITAASLGKILLLAKEYSKAEPLLRDAVRIGELTADAAASSRTRGLKLHWLTALVKLGRFDEAEPLLRQVYESATADSSPEAGAEQKQSALSLLIELNEAQGDDDEAQRYRALHDK